MPPAEQLKALFIDSFCLYKPVNDLGGVFYWLGRTKDNKGILVGIDCNEKGVKGALLTMLFVTALKDIIYKKKILIPDNILAELDKHFQATEEDKEEIGFNVSVLVIDNEKKYVTFSGAGQNMYYQDANDDIEIAEGINGQIGKGSLDKNYSSFSGTFEEVKAIYILGSNTAEQISNSARSSSLQAVLDDVSGRPYNEQKEELMIHLAESISGKEQQYDVMIIGAKLT